MLQVVICDDEQIALKKVKRELIRYRESRKVHFKILEYDNPELLYYDVTDGNLSEVYILDVDMPKKNGLTLVETVHEKNSNAEVLILSAFPEYGVDAVNIGGIRRYVTKDLLGKKLFSALDDVFRMVKKNQEELYSRYWHNEKRLVEKDRILYIQKVGKYCDFTVEGEEELRERMSITDVFDKLASDAFVYIDRGIIANIPHIMSTEDALALMSDGNRLPISRSRLKDVRAAIHGYWGERR